MSSQCMCMLSKITQMTPKTQLQIWKYVKCFFPSVTLLPHAPFHMTKPVLIPPCLYIIQLFTNFIRKRNSIMSGVLVKKVHWDDTTKNAAWSKVGRAVIFLNWSMKQILWRDLLITALSDFVCWNVLFPIVNCFSRAIIKRIEQQLVCFSSTLIYREIVRFGNISSHLFGTTIKYYTNSNVVHTHLV